MWHPRCIPTPESIFDPLWESPLNLVNLQPSCDSSKCKAVKLIPESITIDCSFIFVFFISSMAFKKSQKRYSGRKFWKEERKEFSRETEREYWKNEGIFKLMKKGYWSIWGKVRFVKIDKKRNIRYSEITKNDLQQASSITTLKTIFKYILLNTHVYSGEIIILENITSWINFVSVFSLKEATAIYIPLAQSWARIFTIARVYGNRPFFRDVKIFDGTWRHYVAC